MFHSSVWILPICPLECIRTQPHRCLGLKSKLELKYRCVILSFVTSTHWPHHSWMPPATLSFGTKLCRYIKNKLRWVRWFLYYHSFDWSAPSARTRCQRLKLLQLLTREWSSSFLLLRARVLAMIFAFQLLPLLLLDFLFLSPPTEYWLDRTIAAPNL
jgi:hypothetical protein